MVEKSYRDLVGEFEVGVGVRSGSSGGGGLSILFVEGIHVGCVCVFNILANVKWLVYKSVKIVLQASYET